MTVYEMFQPGPARTTDETWTFHLLFIRLPLLSSDFSSSLSMIVYDDVSTPQSPLLLALISACSFP